VKVMTDLPGIENVNVLEHGRLRSPAEMKHELPVSAAAAETILSARRAIAGILDRTDHRLLVVVGPCSIHDEAAALEYAAGLRDLAEELDDTLLIVMRAYFEKPRTVTGWKGFINDPDLDGSFKIDDGLYRARKLLLEIAELGLPTGSEALDPITPQYLSDTLAWMAIGARTTESQTHREMASGLSTPIGFKNGTDGNLDVAINAMRSSAAPHHFLGIDPEGKVAVIQTRGNRYGHVILRGGGGRPNYDSVSMAQTESLLAEAALPKNIMVDCSHGNSSKDPSVQPLVLRNCASQIRDGNRSIIGVMLESHLYHGNQKLTADLGALRYGVSITDACIDWQTTADALREARERLAEILPQRG
jgi:3-deoxy-7-phosphoheptulonate synthase